MKPPKLKFHEKSCSTCRYYRIHVSKYSSTTDCLLLGRMLSFYTNPDQERAKYCDGWKKRPKRWEVRTKKSPFWHDKYIPPKTQINLRKRLGIK